MKRRIVLVLIMAVAVGAAACQKTPEEKVVMQKDFPDEIMNYEEHSSESAFIYENGYDVPQGIKESFQSEKKDLTVEIESEISVPDVDRFPIVLIENYLLSQEEVDNMIFTLVGDKQLYKIREKDKQDYMEDITYFKGVLAALETKDEKSHLDEVRIEGYENIIRVFGSDMEEAPDYVERQESGTKLIQSTEDKYHQYLRLECDMGKMEPAKTYVNLSTKDSSSYFEYINVDLLERMNIYAIYKSMEYYDAANLNNPNELEISVDDAKKQAEEAVKSMGFNNYEANTVSLAYKENYTEYERYDKCPQCYEFYFTPVYYGIPITYEVTQGASNDYSKSWLYESLIVCVDDSGVIYMKLTEPSIEVKKIQEGAELIEFNEIMDIFRRQIIIQGVWNDLVEAKNRTLYIDEITLGYMKIAVPDNPEEFILTPVWDFFGYKETEYDKDTYTGLILDENNRYRTRDFRHSYLTINAIDGSIIDRSLGY